MSEAFTERLTAALTCMAESERGQETTARDFGGVLFGDRVDAVASMAAETFPGDLLEIGVYAGATAVRLADVATRFGRRYLGIDSWLPHPDYRHDEQEPIAREALRPFGTRCDLVRCDAHGDEGKAIIRSRPWCFALSDNGHSYEDHRADLWMLAEAMPAGVIAVDDVYVPDVMRAMNDFLRDHPTWKLVNVTAGLREYYLVREP